ncbi:MAG: hypothetical protein ACQEWI_02385 [Bacillota bacterium]
MYHIENQEKLYLHSKIDELNQTIERLQESYLYAEVQHYKERISSLLINLEKLNEEIEVNRVSEEELMKDRNGFKEGKEKLEVQVNALHHQLHNKEELLYEKVKTIHELEQRLLQIENERKNLSVSFSKLEEEVVSIRHKLHNKEDVIQEKVEMIKEFESTLLKTEAERKNLSLSLSKLKESQHKSSTENSAIINENQTLLQLNHSLNTKIHSQQEHIADLNAALNHSEETKKEMFHSLISKTEELEKLMAERKHTLDSLQFAKDQLIESEKQKMDHIKTFIGQYQKHFEENEWWLSTQFADIDQRAKQQDERIEAVEQEQELHFMQQNEVLMEKFEDVEQRFVEFIEEVDSIRDHNSKMTNNLFELKRLVEHQKKSHTHIITPRQKPPADKITAQRDHHSIKNEKN